MVIEDSAPGTRLFRSGILEKYTPVDPRGVVRVARVARVGMWSSRISKGNNKGVSILHRR